MNDTFKPSDYGVNPNRWDMERDRILKNWKKRFFWGVVIVLAFVILKLTGVL